MSTWSKGQPWRVVRSLDRLNTQIRAAYPRAVPPATPASSWGSIADSAHSSTSDHYPHYYSVLGSTAVVCARDFPHAPALGLDAHALADRLRLSRDPRIGYIISNRRITGPQHGWRWDPYSGPDPHDTHIHVSTVHTAAADDPRDWQIGDDMTPAEMLAAKIHNDVTDTDVAFGTFIRSFNNSLARLEAGMRLLQGKDFTDEEAIVRGVLAGLPPEKIAAAIPSTVAKDVADELARRIAS